MCAHHNYRTEAQTTRGELMLKLRKVFQTRQLKNNFFWRPPPNTISLTSCECQRRRQRNFDTLGLKSQRFGKFCDGNSFSEIINYCQIVSSGVNSLFADCPKPACNVVDFSFFSVGILTHTRTSNINCCGLDWCILFEAIWTTAQKMQTVLF